MLMVHAGTPQKKIKSRRTKNVLFKTKAFHGNQIQENSLAHVKKELSFYEETKQCPESA